MLGLRLYGAPSIYGKVSDHGHGSVVVHDVLGDIGADGTGLCKQHEFVSRPPALIHGSRLAGHRHKPRRYKLWLWGDELLGSQLRKRPTDGWSGKRRNDPGRKFVERRVSVLRQWTGRHGKRHASER